MDKILKCEDTGMDCVFAACGKTEEEVVTKAARHAREAHGASGAAADFEEKTRWAIYDGYCDHGDTGEMLSEECFECYSECYDCADECCC
jgi:predicted small metal-binding protein